MQIVIELDEKFYEWLMTKDDTQEVVYKAVRKGIPLPKGHGDLIDLDTLKGKLWWVSDCPHIKLNEQALEIWRTIEKAPTVLKADKEEE